MAISRQVIHFSGHPGLRPSCWNSMGVRWRSYIPALWVPRTAPRAVASVSGQAFPHHWRSSSSQGVLHHPTATCLAGHVPRVPLLMETVPHQIPKEIWRGSGRSGAQLAALPGPAWLFLWPWCFHVALISDSCPWESYTMISWGSSPVILFSQAQHHLQFLPGALEGSTTLYVSLRVWISHDTW